MTIALLISSAPVEAQSQTSRFELTPFAAYRVGGTFSEDGGDGQVELNDSSAQGIIFNVKAKNQGQYELLYSRQSTDANTTGFFSGDPKIKLDVEHLQFGGTYLFDGQNTRPFLALTLGATRFDSTSGSKTFPSASFGAGIQLGASSRFGVRLEARVLTTFVDKGSSFFCESDGGEGSCLVLIEGNLLTQWEARAGLVFRF